LTPIFALQKPRSLDDIALLFPAIDAEILNTIFVFLLNAGLVSEVDDKGQNKEEANETLQQWDFHDLLFHARSRNGRTMKGYGGTYRFWGQIPPLPAVKPPMSDDYIDLYKPDMETVAAEDQTLAAVMEARRSIREYDDENPITAEQIGEFLYRVARVEHVFAYDDVRNGRPEQLELSRRPYPGGGAQYELEFYLTIRHCNGIPSGFYHYCPLNHRLFKISAWNDQTAELLKRGTPMPGAPLPQLLITLAARFSRIAWKYESTAYAVMLKNCGVLYHSMYLVATAMELAPCGIGGGDSDLFAQIAGTDYYAETSVGEFILGSRLSS
jgi:SagB-type dehydrogenase family enzyme